MPTHMRFRVSWQYRDANPKNQAVINPCFRRSLDISDPLSGTNAQQLVDDLVAALDGWYSTTGRLTVSAYNIEAPKPNFPMATKTVRPTGVQPLTGPGELACCLSFYGATNVPRKRGRLYLPAFVLGASGSDYGNAIVPVALRTKCAALVPIFAGLGGSNVDWGVWSGVGHAFTKAEHWFVNDSWDIQRSRGIAETARDVGTTSG